MEGKNERVRVRLGVCLLIGGVKLRVGLLIRGCEIKSRVIDWGGKERRRVRVGVRLRVRVRVEWKGELSCEWVMVWKC